MRVHGDALARVCSHSDLHSGTYECNGGNRRMGSLIKKRRKRMRKKKHKKMLKRTRWQRRAAGK
jgi:hypothetical protein